jgi:hypothetical protein
VRAPRSRAEPSLSRRRRRRRARGQDDHALRLQAAQGLRALSADEAARGRIVEMRGINVAIGLLPAEPEDDVQQELAAVLEAFAAAGAQYRAMILEYHGCAPRS